MFRCMCYWFIFFFFKQKTAYEMRISDWSSDVCSSDLHGRHGSCRAQYRAGRRSAPAASGHPGRTSCARQPVMPGMDAGRARSEEHTSELQSLMRISYAVFCLKKKTNKQNIIIRIKK